MVSTRVHRNLFDGTHAGAAGEEQHNRDRILDAAATLFAHKGYAGTSVREIVEAASVTKPTLYYYFKNKEDLYVKLLDMAAETFSLLLEETLTRRGAMRERLSQLYSGIFRLFHENIDILRLVNSMIYGPPGATPPYEITKLSDRLETVLGAILDAGIGEEELREDNREYVMLLLMGLLRSIQVLLVLNLPHRSITADSITKAIDTIFDGAGNPLLQSRTTGGGLRP